MAEPAHTRTAHHQQHQLPGHHRQRVLALGEPSGLHPGRGRHTQPNPRGVVEAVDVAALLRAWAAGYDAFKPELASTWLAPTGAAAAVAALPNAAPDVAVTGSFAAVRWAPTAAPTLLVAYARDVQQTATSLGLLPADEGANVILLRPFDEVAFARSVVADGVTYAGPSQVTADCLRGPGRMPAEGEALLNWMVEDESRWRLPSLPAPEPS